MEIMENMNKCLNIQSYLKNSIFKKQPIILSPSKISQKNTEMQKRKCLFLLMKELANKKWAIK